MTCEVACRPRWRRVREVADGIGTGSCAMSPPPNRTGRRSSACHVSRDVVVTDDDGLKAFRNAYCSAIRKFHSEGKPARTWPLRYLIRHTAYHTMDHAWEMEDKDLTGASG